jgi:peptidase YpeB-like protein
MLMKRLITLIGVSYCFIFCGAGECQMSPLSLEGARAKVKAAAGVGDNGFSRAEARVLGGRLVYDFDVHGGDRYAVDGHTGRITSVYYGSRLPERKTDEIREAQQPVEALKELAWNTMRERYPGAASMKLKLRPPHFDGVAFEFSFVQVLPNGAVTDNVCAVSVVADTGDLLSYFEHAEEIPPAAHRQPKVPVQQVVGIAARATRRIELLGAEEPELVYARGRLYWAARIKGIGADGRVGAFLVRIDADTGEPYHSEMYQLLTYPRPLKNRIMVRNKMLPSVWGPVKTRHGLLVSQEVVAALGGTTSRGDSATQIVGEKTVRVDRKRVLSRGGRVFLPVAAIREAFPSTIMGMEVDSKRNAVNFICDQQTAGLWRAERAQPAAVTPQAPGRSTKPADRSKKDRKATKQGGFTVIQQGEANSSYPGSAGMRGLSLGLLIVLAGSAVVFCWALRRADSDGQANQ